MVEAFSRATSDRDREPRNPDHHLRWVHEGFLWECAERVRLCQGSAGSRSRRRMMSRFARPLVVQGSLPGRTGHEWPGGARVGVCRSGPLVISPEMRWSRTRTHTESGSAPRFQQPDRRAVLQTHRFTVSETPNGQLLRELSIMRFDPRPRLGVHYRRRGRPLPATETEPTLEGLVV